MAKTVSLNEFTYSKLAVLSGELTSIIRKPISLGMTVHLALILLRTTLETTELRKILKKEPFTPMSPEEFDEYWDTLYKAITKSQS